MVDKDDKSALILPLNITVSLAMLASILWGIYLATQWKVRNEEWQKTVNARLDTFQELAEKASEERFKSSDAARWGIQLERELSIFVTQYTQYMKIILADPSREHTLTQPRIKIPTPL